MATKEEPVDGAGLVARDLMKQFRRRRVVDGVSVGIRQGEVVGLLGPNGAGKSTTVKCITGILAPTSGQVRCAGLDPWRDRRRHVRNIGVVFGQRTQLWWDLAVQEIKCKMQRKRNETLTTSLEGTPYARTVSKSF